MTILETERLILRKWRAADRQPFAVMNADPLVMEFMPAALSNSDSDLLVDKIEEHIQTHGRFVRSGTACVSLLHRLHWLGDPVISS